MEVLYPNCAGLDVHKDAVVACSRRVVAGKVVREVRTFKTTTSGLLALSEWLAALSCTQILMEATGVYWKPVWHVLGDGDFALTLANAAHVKNVPGRKTDVNDATERTFIVSDKRSLRAGRPAGAWADPRQLCARSADARATRIAADTKAADA